ncbi:hypothetical protein [Candidatus Macondimonas diazotrophica]|uniref:Uncharacterized protein n=1 Tax=Candidatus Macondimonas diazotrophica TaxID=2305248 RepID=A0A4Z0F7Z5_9GAMM|nr:hypothetical protein [Candidatus Macondimonas diazotrophica]TFZ81600.1 hypothetical protein E4680_11910 [Candidatus Macondimonas diazotrophica]
MHSTVRYMYDEATAFRTIDDSVTALTADTDSDAVTLDRLNNIRGADQGQLGAQTYAVVVVVTEATIVSESPDTPEEYSFNIQSDDDVVFDTFEANAVGTYVRLLDAQDMNRLDPDAVSIHLALDVTGTAPSFKYVAWLAPVNK